MSGLAAGGVPVPAGGVHGRSGGMAERHGDGRRGHHADGADARGQASDPAQPVLTGGDRETHVITPHEPILPHCPLALARSVRWGSAHDID
jgi:hypothetical protein